MSDLTEHASARLRQRIDAIEKFLAGTNVKDEQGHLEPGSTAKLYWHYGYLMALKDVLSLFGDGETRQ